MKVQMSSRQLERSGHLGPLCLACGNKRRFEVEGADGTRIAELDTVLHDDVRIVACGRCRSRHSLVIARLD